MSAAHRSVLPVPVAISKKELAASLVVESVRDRVHRVDLITAQLHIGLEARSR